MLEDWHAVAPLRHQNEGICSDLDASDCVSLGEYGSRRVGSRSVYV